MDSSNNFLGVVGAWVDDGVHNGRIYSRPSRDRCSCGPC